VPGTLWLLAATMVLTVAVSTAAAAATRCPSGTACPVDVSKLSLTEIEFGQAAVASGPDWRRHLDQIGPMTAGLAIQATTGLHSLPLSPCAGLGVLAAWAAGALLAGGLLLRRRDA
jgi:ABC-2 type transport system permease protein